MSNINLDLNCGFEDEHGEEIKIDNASLGLMSERLSTALMLGREQDENRAAKCVDWAIQLSNGCALSVDKTDLNYIKKFVSGFGFINIVKIMILRRIDELAN